MFIVYQVESKTKQPHSKICYVHSKLPSQKNKELTNTL